MPLAPQKAEEPTARRCRYTRRGTERCVRVRDVATELFLARGYDSVSLDEIIARAGGSKTNIYSHFGGKEGLFIDVIEAQCDLIVATLQAVDLKNLSFEDGLRRMGHALLEAILAPRHVRLYRQVVSQSERFPSIGRAWVAHGPEARRRVIRDFLTIHEDRLAGVTPVQGACLYHDMLAWTPLSRAVFALESALQPVQYTEWVEEILTLFVNGYTRPVPPGR
ncbi:MAG: TetR/AcrR family transcriptional regulator [Telmatospirillum sp.]|nr:TetR/AcrR family transcriptional regulator [Telmatospirillum sp.]